MTHRRLTYQASLDWLLANDDTTWLDHEYGSPSVTLILTADIFGRSVEQAEQDLRSRRAARGPAPRPSDSLYRGYTIVSHQHPTTGRPQHAVWSPATSVHMKSFASLGSAQRYIDRIVEKQG